MVAREQKVDIPQQGGLPQRYEKLCCLIFNWNDASNGRKNQVDEFLSVIKQRYGAFVTNVVLDYEDLRDAESSFAYHVENFLRKYDRRSSQLLIFYCGGSYAQNGQLFLHPHRHADPSVRWSQDVHRRILSAVANFLIIFDTTYMLEDHYSRMWLRTYERREALYAERGLVKENTLQILTLNGSDTHTLAPSLSSLATNFQEGVTIAQIHRMICDETSVIDAPSPSLYQDGPVGNGKTGIKLYPLSWPRLQKYQHHTFLDPHNDFLKGIESVPLQEDGTCEVLRLRMSSDIQDFSSPLSPVVVKRFTIRSNTREYFRDDFLREKESLVEVSKWNHGHLLGMLATFETHCEHFITLNIVLPYAAGRNLHEFLRLENDEGPIWWKKREFPESDTGFTGCLKDWRYAVYRQAIGLVDALAALHKDKNKKYIIHCDIKPANILIDKGKFKLADFGLSRFKDSDETSKTEWHRGTLIYSPPEKQDLMGRGRDVWALGCVLLEIAVMIRYAFQFVGTGNLVDKFQSDRAAFSRANGGDGNPIFHRTMGTVHEVLSGFSHMRPGLRKRIVLDGMSPVIRTMLQEDQSIRITAAVALSTLKEHYLSLQTDPELRLEIDCIDNPGGPPQFCDNWEFNPMLGANNNGILSPGTHIHNQSHVGGTFTRPHIPRISTVPLQDMLTDDLRSNGTPNQQQERPASCPKLHTANVQNLSQSLEVESECAGQAIQVNRLENQDRKRSLEPDESTIINKKPRWPHPLIF